AEAVGVADVGRRAIAAVDGAAAGAGEIAAQAAGGHALDRFFDGLAAVLLALGGAAEAGRAVGALDAAAATVADEAALDAAGGLGLRAQGGGGGGRADWLALVVEGVADVRGVAASALDGVGDVAAAEPGGAALVAVVGAGDRRVAGDALVGL